MKETQNFEEKLEIAKELLEKLSDPTISLEESMTHYKNGIEILKSASKILENAKQEFSQISQVDEDEK